MLRNLQVGQIFGTPLITTALDDVDADKVAKIVYALRDAGLMYSGPNIGGVQTQGNFLLIEHPEIQKLLAAFVEVIHTATQGADHILNTRGWANIIGRGDKSADAPHNHLPNHWSAVYYPQVPQLQGGEGNILFFDPREVFAAAKPMAIPPRTGLFVMFPSWLRHTVMPVHLVETDRISVSLNAIIGPRPDAPAAAYPPHRLKKRPPGQSPAQEFDPTSPEDFPYPL